MTPTEPANRTKRERRADDPPLTRKADRPPFAERDRDPGAARDAAKEIFEENGFLDARISDIAERAGLSHGSFYHYFESKEEVFREVAAEVDERLSAPLNTVILDPSSSATPYERIPRRSAGTWRATGTRRGSWA